MDDREKKNKKKSCNTDNLVRFMLRYS